MKSTMTPLVSLQSKFSPTHSSANQEPFYLAHREDFFSSFNYTSKSANVSKLWVTFTSIASREHRKAKTG